MKRKTKSQLAQEVRRLKRQISSAQSRRRVKARKARQARKGKQRPLSRVSVKFSRVESHSHGPPSSSIPRRFQSALASRLRAVVTGRKKKTKFSKAIRITVESKLKNGRKTESHEQEFFYWPSRYDNRKKFAPGENIFANFTKRVVIATRLGTEFEKSYSSQRKMKKLVWVKWTLAKMVRVAS